MVCIAMDCAVIRGDLITDFSIVFSLFKVFFNQLSILSDLTKRKSVGEAILH